MKVCKFGGSSLAQKQGVSNLFDIVKSDGERRYIVVSALGRRNETDDKITDVLIKAYTFYSLDSEKEALEYLNIFFERMSEFSAWCGETEYWNGLQKEIYSSLFIKENLYEDFWVSRGEYAVAKILSKYLNFAFYDAKDIVKFYGNEPDIKKCTFDNSLKNAVIPGFYGYDGKKIRLMQRNASDLTGGIVALLSHADVYENWTDIDGIYVYPAEKKLKLRKMRYVEFYAFSKTHDVPFYPQTARLLNGSGIRTVIKNTFEPTKSGTWLY